MNKSQYLTFQLDNELYAVEILKVREIRAWEPVRNIPNTPEFIVGALNLRGDAVPVIDLTARFNLTPQQYSATTVVIVLSTAQNNLMGIVVDAVSDVIEIAIDEIEQKPDFGSKIDIRYMQGIYIAGDSMFLLLNSDKLLAPEELSRLGAISESMGDR